MALQYTDVNRNKYPQRIFPSNRGQDEIQRNNCQFLPTFSNLENVLFKEEIVNHDNPFIPTNTIPTVNNEEF